MHSNTMETYSRVSLYVRKPTNEGKGLKIVEVSG